MADEFMTIRRKADKDDLWTGPVEAAETFIANGFWEKAPKAVQPEDPTNPDTAPIEQ